MNMLEKIIEMFPEEEILSADGFNDAIIGFDDSKGFVVLIYSVSKCLEILRSDMNEEDSMEYFSYNVKGGYFGERTPIWCEDNF